MDQLLPLLLLIVALFWVIRMRRRGRSDASEARDDTVRTALSYRRLARDVLEHSGLALQDADSLRVETMEIVPQAGRRRLVLGVSMSPGIAERDATRLEHVLWRLAHRMQEALAAHVVVVEARVRDGDDDPGASASVYGRAGGGALRLLLAPDGRGWSGDEAVVGALSAAGHPTRGLSLGEVHRALHDSTLDVSTRAD